AMVCLHLLAQIALPSCLEYRAAEIGKFEVVFKEGVRSDGCSLNCVAVSGFV
ncbi:hypothetical protein HAX54_040446, partial [Datura stramonium]|nr:hypothetical protein [Datura stramonium]